MLYYLFSAWIKLYKTFEFMWSHDFFEAVTDVSGEILIIWDKKKVNFAYNNWSNCFLPTFTRKRENCPCWTKRKFVFWKKKIGVSINEIGSECSVLIELVFISFHLLREKCFIRESNFVPIIKLFSFHFVLLTVVCAYFSWLIFIFE